MPPYLNFGMNISDSLRQAHAPLQSGYFGPNDVSFKSRTPKRLLACLFDEPRADEDTANHSPYLAQEKLNSIELESKFNANKRSGPNSLCPSRSLMDQVLDDPSLDSKCLADKDLNLSLYRPRREPSTDNKSIGSMENLLRIPRQPVSARFTFHYPQVQPHESRPVRNGSLDTRHKACVKPPRLASSGPRRQGLVELPRTIHFESNAVEKKEQKPKLGQSRPEKVETGQEEKGERGDLKGKKKGPEKSAKRTGRRWRPEQAGTGDKFCLETELRSEMDRFRKNLEENPQVPQEKKDLLIFLLRFLFNFPIEHSEFLGLSRANRTVIKKFVVDRFFRAKQAKRKSTFLEKRSTFLDEEPGAKATTRDLPINLPVLGPGLEGQRARGCLETIEAAEQARPGGTRRGCQTEVILREDEIKPGIMDFLEQHEFTRGHFEHSRCASSGDSIFRLMMPRISASQVLSEAFDFRDLQCFLEKREILSIVCKRKQQHERRGKRNDEKTKKVFKRVMKNMLRAHKQALLRTQKKVTSVEAGRVFYEGYFGQLGEDLRCFYDPLKRRVKNPRFRSISNDYLAGLKRSERFVQDFLGFCAEQEKMVFQELSGYSDNLLDKFRRNPGFLGALEKAKSKFEWVNFELKVAVVHFLFTFQNAASKRKLEC